MKNKRFFRRLKKFLLFIVFGVFVLGLSSLKTFAYSGEVVRYVGEPITMTFAIYHDSNYQVRLGNDEESSLLFTIQSGIANFYGPSGDTIPIVPNLDGWFLNVSCYPEVSSDLQVSDLLICFDWFRQINYVSISNLGTTGWYKYDGFSYDDLTNFYILEYDTNFTERLIYVVNDNAKGYSSSSTSVVERVDFTIDFLLDNFNQLVLYGFNNGYSEGYNRGILDSEQGNFANFGIVLLTMVNNFLAFEILPNFSLLNILYLCIAIGFVIVILKFYAGG